MIINKIRRYKLTKDISTRTSCSVCQLKKGEILNITQIDSQGHKAMGDKLMDWMDWDMPVEQEGVRTDES